MHTRILSLLVALALLAPFAAVSGVNAATPGGAPEPCTPSGIQPRLSAAYGTDPTASVSPVQGPAGSTATIHVWNFLPGQDVSAIMRIAGDPVIAKGATDENGEAYLQFIVPTASEGSYWIFAFQENRTCVHAAVHFRVGPAFPNPTPAPTQTPTPVRPVPPTIPPPPTATPARPTPVAPAAGTGGADSGLFGNASANLVGLVAGLALVSAGFAALGRNRRRRTFR